MTNIAVIGAGGRMGKALIETIAATDGVQLKGALEPALPHEHIRALRPLSFDTLPFPRRPSTLRSIR